MSEIIEINPPITRNYFLTFMSNYIQLKYFNDKTISLESLKNLIFPSDYSEKNFSNFLVFIDKASYFIVNKNLNEDETSNLLKKEAFDFKAEHLSIVFSSISKKMNEIQNYLNNKFNYSKEKCELVNVSWAVKTVLSGSNEDGFYNDRYCDLELSIKNKNYDDNSKIGIISNNSIESNNDKVRHLNLTLIKQDVMKLHKELNNIKLNINRVRDVSNTKLN